MSELIQTKEAALNLSLTLWKGLAETGQGKTAFCSNDSYFNKFFFYHAKCPLCEYTKNRSSNSTAKCELCPVKWTNNKPSSSSPCQDDLSLFHKWEFCIDEECKKKYATKIADLIQKTIQDQNRIKI